MKKIILFFCFILISPALATSLPQPLLRVPVSDLNTSIIQKNSENLEYHRRQLYNGTASLEVKSILINGVAPLTTSEADVKGPASSTDTAIPRFSGTGGKTIQNSGITVDSSNHITIPGDVKTDTIRPNATTVTNITAPLVNTLQFNTGAGRVAVKMWWMTRTLVAADIAAAGYTFTIPDGDTVVIAKCLVFSSIDRVAIPYTYSSYADKFNPDYSTSAAVIGTTTVRVQWGGASIAAGDIINVCLMEMQ